MNFGLEVGSSHLQLKMMWKAIIVKDYFAPVCVCTYDDDVYALLLYGPTSVMCDLVHCVCYPECQREVANFES